MSVGSATLDFIKKSPKSSVAIPAGITAAALLLWPKKETEITNEQGEVETVRKNSGFKKSVVAVGTIATVAALTHHYGPTKGWADKISAQKIASQGNGGPSV